MALKDVAGIFSAKFVIGFFAPTFFTVIAVSQVIDVSSMSTGYASASAAGQILMLGGGALLLALLLSGLHYPVLRLFEGYPLKRFRDVKGLAWLYRFAVGRWERRYERLARVKNQPTASPQRTAAAVQLSRNLPSRGQLLPTRFGNAVRAFERHPREPYGLDGVTIWPRIEMLLSEPERKVISEGETDVAFFVNATLLLPVFGVVLIVDAVTSRGLATPWWLVYAFPFVAVYGTYRAAVGAAFRWGSAVRAAFDLHRIELYQRLGVKLPMSPSEEIDTARTVNRMLLYGEPIPKELRSISVDHEGKGDDDER